MATTADIRNGLCLDMNNDIWQVVEFLHVKPGKGNAFVRSKLKSLTTGKVVENTFSSGSTLNVVRIERRTYQYLLWQEIAYQELLSQQLTDRYLMPYFLFFQASLLRH